jgi:hypothetical protein
MSTPEQELPWHDRKARVRQKLYETLVKPTEDDDPPPIIPETSGDAPSPDVPEAVRSGLAAASRRLASTATSATATAPAASSTSRPPSGTPAPSTPPSSSAPTVWQTSPVGFLEANLSPTTVDPSGSLVPGLPPNVQSSLRALATGRGEPIPAVIQAIVEFYVEAEDDRCEATLGEMLQHYCENQLLY